jgi:HJR/Mrr/RecB family endonuclease
LELFFTIIAFFSLRAAIYHRWQPRKKMSPSRVDEIRKRKREINQQVDLESSQIVTAFAESLKKFITWEKLSARDFELAVAVELEKRGYKARPTRYSRDGGVDLEGTNPDGRPAIVQAKRFKSNVGVAVIREMIGVGSDREDDPEVVVFALNGFTRGAKDLAAKHGVLLMDARSVALEL